MFNNFWTSLLCQVNFFPPNFSFVFWKRKFGGKKDLLGKEGFSKIFGQKFILLAHSGRNRIFQKLFSSLFLILLILT
jgi:hypothetical protein